MTESQKNEGRYGVFSFVGPENDGDVINEEMLLK